MLWTGLPGPYILGAGNWAAFGVCGLNWHNSRATPVCIAENLALSWVGLVPRYLKIRVIMKRKKNRIVLRTHLLLVVFLSLCILIAPTGFGKLCWFLRQRVYSKLNEEKTLRYGRNLWLLVIYLFKIQ